MILVFIAAKFTVKCIFEQLKYISKFSETSCISNPLMHFFFLVGLNKSLEWQF